MVEIYQELYDKHPKAPIIVAGDFNGNASLTNTDEEFRPLYEQTKLKDVLEWSNTPATARSTFYHVRSGLRADGRQIDFCFLPPELEPLLNKNATLVYRFKDERGLEIDVPHSIDAKLNLPSDHYPLVFEIDNLPSW